MAQDYCRTDFVQRIWLLIPERGRLAQRMASNPPLQPDAMRQAMQDLHLLCIQDHIVLYPAVAPHEWGMPYQMLSTSTSQVGSLSQSDMGISR